MSVIATDDGRILTGIVLEQNDSAITLQTQDEKLVISAAEVDELRLSPLSMMPEGQFDKLTQEEIRDLVAYLRTRSQVPFSGE